MESTTRPYEQERVGVEILVKSKLFLKLHSLNFSNLTSLLVIMMEIRDVDCGILLPTKSSLE
jgi:hypothetical protein